MVRQFGDKDNNDNSYSQICERFFSALAVTALQCDSSREDNENMIF